MERTCVAGVRERRWRAPPLIVKSLFLDGGLHSGIIRTIDTSGDECSGCGSRHSNRICVLEASCYVN